MIKVDLHVHSSASFDCLATPGQVAARCRRLGFGPVFLTDHNSIAGALQLREVVIGEEVMTTEGEVIGLFLQEVIPPGLSANETVSRIKAQGGLVYLEHPYDPFRRHLKEEAVEALRDSIDIVEVWNGRADREINRNALQLCELLGAAAAAGSDAHSVDEIGRVYVEMDAFEGPQDFLAKLRRGAVRRKGFRLPFTRL